MLSCRPWDPLLASLHLMEAKLEHAEDDCIQ